MLKPEIITGLPKSLRSVENEVVVRRYDGIDAVRIPYLVEKIAVLERRFEIPRETILAGDNIEGIFICSDAASYRAQLDVPGAVLFTLESPISDTLLGFFIYYTRESCLPAPQRKITTSVRRYLFHSGQPLPNDSEMALCSIVLIDHAVKNFPGLDGGPLRRAEIYSFFHHEMMAELRRRNICFVAGQCRWSNPALYGAHAALGWRTLGRDAALQYAKRYPGDIADIEVSFALLYQEVFTRAAEKIAENIV